MATKKELTKKKIIEATISLLENTDNPDEVTVRKIADAAGIGIGLINYHFHSRDRLINEAITQKIDVISKDMQEPFVDQENPVIYLKNMLISMSDLALKNSKLNQISVEYELLNGDFKICLTLLPILKKIFGETKSDTQLRFLAYQMIVTTQTIYIRQEAFHLYSGVDIKNKSERDKLLCELVDTLI